MTAKPNSLEGQLQAEEEKIAAVDVGYVERGKALDAIRVKGTGKKKLYQANEHETFEDYLAARWRMSKVHAYRFIDAAAVAGKSNPMGYFPPTERAARPFTEFRDDKGHLDLKQVERALAYLRLEDGERWTQEVSERTIQLYKDALAKNWITLAEWAEMSKEEQTAALELAGDREFNKQSNASIEWAQWSWNPITGCKHDCPYCYARDLANLHYPQKFEPALVPERLTAPANTTLPAQAKTDIAYRNVFTGSMADLFGRWVPAEWIEAVLAQVRAAPQWNFLFLTKFPKRLVEFDFPTNAWLGTTVDCQARVKAAEAAFSQVNATVKWLSIEPMIEPLNFEHLDLFNWIVLGGASKSTMTPEWRVPTSWWFPLYLQALESGAEIFMKENLFARERGFLGRPDPLRSAPTPEVFQYLGGKTEQEIISGEAP